MQSSSKKKRSTKKKTFSNLIGSKRLLKEDVLPSNRDVLRYYLWLDGNCFATILEKVTEIWCTAGFTTNQLVTTQRRKQKLKKLHYGYRQYDSKSKSKKSTSNSNEKREMFEKDLNKLFDIASCKCNQNCNCLPIELKIFLTDQRTKKTMKVKDIRNNDSFSNNAGVIENSHCDDHDEMNSDNTSNVNFYDETSSICETIDNDNDHDYELETDYLKDTVEGRRNVTKKYNTSNVIPIATVADRYGVSHRAAAAIASTSLQSKELVTPTDHLLVVDPGKIRRARDKLRENLKSRDAFPFIGLYFDGRKDRTLFFKKDNSGVFRKSIRKEEHVSLIGEPGGQYLNHVSLKRGRALDILQGILEKVDTDFDAIGCDGTVVNTGIDNGVIRRYEMHLGHPLQWLICQLHFNELPLRALFIYVDGPTTGDTAFSGVIGKALPTVETLPVVKFKRIQNTIPELRNEMKADELSSDQHYLYDMCQAISNGNVSSSLANRSTGKLNHSRWLTLANRCLRLYVASSNPSTDLRLIVTYILKVYAPSFFRIKMNHKCVDGPKNLFHMMKSSRYLPKEYLTVVDKSIQTNGYFAQPENILIAMIHDDKKDVRKNAYRRIVEARAKSSDDTVRKFEIPPINFKAKTYCNLIDWKTTVITEPPLMKRFSDSDLTDLVNQGDNSNIWNSAAFRLPNHTQAVERCVKIVTESSQKVAGDVRRDGYIRSVFNSRKLMPQFNTKKEFKDH